MNTIGQTTKLSHADQVELLLKEKEGHTASLKELYDELGHILKHSLRRAILTDSRERFVNIQRGVWMLKDGDVSGIIIEGDSRKLDEIEDSSIDSIITDHPWLDKNLKGGNRDFCGTYGDTAFRYTQEDFNEKARVLKDGGYLIEFAPVESESNWEYLAEIKRMAKKAGLRFYSKVMWHKSPSNTGRTVKEVEDILIFTKGKPRRINDGSRKQPYSTRNQLKQLIPAPLSKKNKNHEAEKPISLFEYLIEQTTEIGQVVLDQFGGSCNCLRAALNLKRMAVVYEYKTENVKKAVDRFGAGRIVKAIDDIKDKVTVVRETVHEVQEELLQTKYSENGQLSFILG